MYKPLRTDVLDDNVRNDILGMSNTLPAISNLVPNEALIR
jgi:hypothetical protein